MGTGQPIFRIAYPLMRRAMAAAKKKNDGLRAAQSQLTNSTIDN